MSLYVSHISALQCLASAEDVSPVMALRNALPRRRGPLPHGCRATAADLEPLSALGLPYLAAPVHALVPNAASRSACARLTCHVRSGNFPRRSFRPVAAHVFASMPELCFVQMAETFTPARLIRLGMELCGYKNKYLRHLHCRPSRLRPRPSLHDRRPTEPLRERSRIHAGSQKGSPGRVSPRPRIGVAPGNSARPAAVPSAVDGRLRPSSARNESQHAREMARPSAQHGQTLCLRPALARRGDCRQYITYKKGKLADDARRRNDLLAHGITIVPVTTRTVQNLIELDQVAQLLARRLGSASDRTRSVGRKTSTSFMACCLKPCRCPPQHGHRAL